MPWIAHDDAEIINPMLDHLKDLSSTYLTQVTIHQKPWIRNYSSYETRIIPVNEIRDYFKED